MNFTLEEILKATGAKVLKSQGVDGLKFDFSTDTRTIKNGEIYLPLKGENFDGEKFIDKALEMGAVGYFVMGKDLSSSCPPLEGGPKSKISTNLSPNNNQLFGSAESLGEGNEAKLVLQVEDTLVAYLELAGFYKNKINPKTVAITGSSGKTTTKEMAYCVASENFKTHKSELNFNNEIGLCKTLLSMPIDTEVLILEMGMRGLGEIELLSKYSTPDITIIANVGTAHIGRLGSKENIAQAKCEIVKHQKEGGLIIAHEDELIKKTLHSSPLNLQTTYFSLEDTKILERKIGYSKFIYKKNEYELNIEGDYNIQNSLAVIEMGLKLGMAPSEIKNGLKKYLPIEKRWEIQEIKKTEKSFKLINDSYNANPESVKAALKTFLELYHPPLLIVLGDMGELGKDELRYHKEIGEFLSKNLTNCKNVKLITIGKLANEITLKLNGYNIFSKNFDTNLQTSRYILDNVENGTTIILKASRSMKFEEIINDLKDNS